MALPLRMSKTDPLLVDFAARHPDSFARVLAQSSFADIDQILDSLPAERVAGILARLPGKAIDRMVASGQTAPVNWLQQAPFEDAVALLSRMPRQQRIGLIEGIAEADRRTQLMRLQRYPVNSLGSLVGDIPPLIDAQTPVARALVSLRQHGDKAPRMVVVVNGEGHYLGVLDHWRLVLEAPTGGVAGDFLVSLKPLPPDMLIRKAVREKVVLGGTDWPIVDHRKRVLGIVSSQQIFHAAWAMTGTAREDDSIFWVFFQDFVSVCERVMSGVLARGSAR